MNGARTLVTLAAGLALSCLFVCVVTGPVRIVSVLQFIGIPTTIFVTLPALAFWLWNPQLFRGLGGIPGRSFAALVALSVISIAWLAYIWLSGFYLVSFYPYAVSTASVLSLLGLWGLYFTAAKRGSFASSLTFHFLAGAWVLTVAFPVLAV